MPAFRHVLFPALTVLFGIQSLKGLMTGLVFYLGDAQGVDSPILGLYAALLFLLAFVAGPLVKLFGMRWALGLTAGGLALVRLAEQFTVSPLGDLVLTSAGTALFLMAIPMHAQLRAPGLAGRSFPVAVLLGLATESAIKGALGTMELSWVRGVSGATLLVLLVAIHWLCGLVTLLRAQRAEAAPVQPSFWPLIGLGPALALELLIFQNIGRLTVLTEWSQAQVFAWIALGNALGVWLTCLLPAGFIKWRIVLIAGVLLFALVLVDPSGPWAAVVQLLGHLLVVVLLVALGVGMDRAKEGGRFNWPTVASGLGMLLLLVLLFSYYASYDMAMPLSRRAVAPIAAALVMLGVLTAAPAGLRSRVLMPAAAVPALWSGLLLLAPLAYLLSYEEPQAVQGNGFPVRVMSYNLHQGFDLEGHPSVRELAEDIRRERPDIVALQEVSRGWLTTGAFDMLVWTAREVDLPYVWGPAADPVWGNAILSRFPILSAKTYPMPNNGDLRLKRAFTAAQVDIGAGKQLQVIATHLHHPVAEGYKRQPQVKALLGFWGNQGSTIILGDFNIRPGEPEGELLKGGGLRDAFVASGAPPDGFTSRSSVRIDYIWLSPDLDAGDFSVSGTWASDHRAIAATVSPRGTRREYERQSP